MGARRLAATTLPGPRIHGTSTGVGPEGHYRHSISNRGDADIGRPALPGERVGAAYTSTGQPPIAIPAYHRLVSEQPSETSGNDPAGTAAAHSVRKHFRRTMLSTGFSDVPGKTCEVCGFQGFRWQTECPDGHPLA